ncbi:MAG: octopine/nopaline dehydrogenase [Ramlibacter sp.]|nr:octopine/nopaline dehydrogenase [Ramlibacter sp.]
MKIGILGTGATGLGNAAWLAHAGHEVTVWSPGGQGARALLHAPLRCEGILQTEVRVGVAADPQQFAQLVQDAQVLLVALPNNGHRAVMDRLLPHLRTGQTVIVSSMNSLSALYLFEQAGARGVDITVASFGTTVFATRRTGETQARINAKRLALGVATLPHGEGDKVLALCRALFGDVFVPHAHCLETMLTNTNPVAHGPLALFNWTRVERAEQWPQYHYLTPQVADVILRLDAERLALARAFGLEVRTIEEHFAASFGTTSATLADIAAELHAKRGGPPGPTDVATRYLSEDIPFGLAFGLVLGELAGVAMEATRTVVASASLLLGRDLAAENDLIAPLGLRGETAPGLLRRVRA